MTNLFSRDLLLRMPRPSFLQVFQPPKNLQIIPEEDEPCTSATYSSSIRPEKRTFSTSHINVFFGGHQDEHKLLSSSGPAPPLPSAPPKSCSYDNRSGANSPTPSTCSSSSGLPTTPTSDDDLSTSHFIPQHNTVKPLNITKKCTKLASFSPQEEASNNDESDYEWYTREFSKIISLNSLLPPHQRPPPPRPESLLIEPIMIEAISCATQSPIPVEPRSQSLKRTVAVSHKRTWSIPKETLPPVPPIPVQSSEVPSIPQSVQASNSTVNAKPRPRYLSLRRPPPRSSIPDDCLTDDVVTGADESSWPSVFDICSYEDSSPVPSPEIIPPTPSSSARVISPTGTLTIPQVQDSQPSMHSQTSDVPRQEFEEFDAFEGFEEIEFAVDDVKFDLNVDLPMRLPFSLPNSPIDLETDFAIGLEELRKVQDDLTTLVPPIIAISGPDEITGQQESECALPESPIQHSFSLPLTPSTASSFDSSYAGRDAEVAETPSTVEEESIESSIGHTLSSKWSSSTLASTHEEHASRSSKSRAASKLGQYFGGGRNSPSSKHGQNQTHQEQKQQKHKRSGSAGAIAAAKAAVARAATSAIHRSSSSYLQPSPVSSPSIATPTAVKKKAQRQVVVVQPPSSSSFLSYYPRMPTSPKKPSTSSTPSPPGSPSINGKRKAAWSQPESDVMVIGYGYGGVGKEFRRSLTPTVSDAESEESCASWSSNGLRRKPIPVEMFLRNANA